ncbi:GtrA family protein [Bacillus sp. AK128]
MQVSNDFLKKFIKYSAVGIISTTIYFLSVFILVEGLYLNPVHGAALSFVIMTIVSFLLNKRFTFGGLFTKTQLIRFFTVSMIGFILNYLIMYTVVNILSLHYFIGELTTVLIIPILNFTLNYMWTFK